MNYELRIKILFFIFIIFMGAGAFAKTKIALIGDSKKTNQLADMVLAKMADNDNLEFLERAAIEKVLKEHKLQSSGLSSNQIPIIAKILHTDIFAVLSSAQVNKKTVPSSLRVFDARNGFCLIDTALPADIEKCTAFISDKLKNLPDKKSLKFISILAVRNAGAPAKYKRQMAHVAMEIERRLIAMPDVAVLERSELGLINKERKISKKLFKLASSAYLLDFEFAPASSADKVDLRIYVFNTSGKELKSFNFPDCLKAKPQQMIKALAKYLKTSPAVQVVNIKQEAKRFFKEYEFFKQNKKYYIAKRKIETVIALRPDNPDDLYELADILGRFELENFRRKKTLEHYTFALEALKKIIKLNDEIKSRFPDFKKCLYKAGHSTMQLLSIYTAIKLLNAQKIKETRKVMKEFREKSFPELQKHYWKFNLNDGINSKKNSIMLVFLNTRHAIL